MLLFADTAVLLRAHFEGRIRLERLREDRVMSDREDGEGTALVQASKGAALTKLSVFLGAPGEATDGDADGIVMHAAGLTFGRWYCV